MAHRRTRLAIDRALGLLKRRFRCLNLRWGRLLRTPEWASKTLVVCAMLHNLCVRRKIPVPDPEEGHAPVTLPPVEKEPPCLPQQDPVGAAIRDRVAAEYFG